MYSRSTTGLVIDGATGDIDIAASSVGTYTVTNAVPAAPGCPAVSATTSFTITGPPVADFQYVGSPFCQNVANPNPSFLNGGIAGTFSAAPIGLTFVSTATGQIDLAASTPGTYTVTNTVAAANGCAAVSADFEITINVVQDGSFTYGSPSYCSTGSDPSAIITGTGGGLFSSSPTGLIFTDVNNGTIDVSASTIGSLYCHLHYPANPCPDAQTFTIAITAICQ